jgi:hypothetical protein
MKKHLTSKLQLRKLTIATFAANRIRGGAPDITTTHDDANNSYLCVAEYASYDAYCYNSKYIAADGVCLATQKCIADGCGTQHPTSCVSVVNTSGAVNCQ